MSKLIFAVIISILSITAVGYIRAQEREESSNLARFTVLKAKTGFETQFAEGYKAHLKWHIDNGDTWNWLGWFISSGERLGVFVDATFERSWADFDNPLKPAEDRADLAKNVIPYVEPVTQFTAAFLNNKSNARFSDLTANYQRVLYLDIRPGFEDEFQQFLSGFRQQMTRVDPDQKFGWYQVVEGGSGPQFILMLPHGSYAEFSGTDSIFEKVIGSDEPMRKRFKASVKKIYSETMRYRADLTYLPKSEAGEQ